MPIHARFRLSEVARTAYYTEPHQAARVKLHGVQGEPFGLATPSANLDMMIVNPEAAQEFFDAVMGQEYDVVFTPVVKTAR